MKTLWVLGICLQISFCYPHYKQTPIAEPNQNFIDNDINIKIPRNGLIDNKFHWPRCEVPYVIQNNYTKEELFNIHKAFDAFHKNTCIKFRPKTKADEDYLYIRPKNPGCHSEIGRQGGRQYLNLRNPLCTRKPGLVMHELMHTIGFYHEQSRSDRDDHVTIVLDNVMTSKKSNFEKFEEDVISSFGESYDYGSIMHYNENAFSKNGKKTIVLKDPSALVGQRMRLSKSDIKKINAMYKNICPPN